MYHHRLQNLVDDLKELAYPLEAPQKVRTVPMQVLAVEPPRSGTDSLRGALVKLGYDHVYHGYDIALNPEDDKAWWKLYQKKLRPRPRPLRRLWPAFCRGGDFEHTGRWVLEEHCAMVRGSVMRSGEPGRELLEWSVEDGWEPLCRFLGKPI
ncbi:hypothetical protein PG996_012123 [Apiospora saccharicola]|uniref:Uncharacterized protein n=1 Tax=Apiospora saccharicola TaxID=335842 RepID=A0ABR1U294_9PEZI